MQLQPNRPGRRVARPAGDRSSTSTVSEPQNPCAYIYTYIYICTEHANTRLRSPILTINPLAPLTSILGLRIAGSCTTDFPRFVRACTCKIENTGLADSSEYLARDLWPARPIESIWRRTIRDDVFNNASRDHVGRAERLVSITNPLFYSPCTAMVLGRSICSGCVSRGVYDGKNSPHDILSLAR